MNNNLFTCFFISAIFLASCKENVATESNLEVSEEIAQNVEMEIPLQTLEMSSHSDNAYQSTSVLKNEIEGVLVDHIFLTNQDSLVDVTQSGYKSIYLFVKGTGTVNIANKEYEIVPETILVPTDTATTIIRTTANDTLHYLKILRKQSLQDLEDIKTFPVENTSQVYYAKFTDCKPYTEPIKSPNTVSRTILPNQYIPRIAMGTVQTTGPDKVGAHEHPMLEQLFLGLSENDCTVYADSAQVYFPEYSVLHIPLGSSHSVSVEENAVMYYVWMDFFKDKDGEEWLKTHNQDDE